MSEDDDDRRRHPRFDVRLEGVLDGYRVFETLKLSAGGMLIRLPGDIGLEQRVTVSLSLGGEGTFRAPARVVFLGPDFAVDDGRERSRVGLAFEDAPPAELACLQRFIARELQADAQR